MFDFLIIFNSSNQARRALFYNNSESLTQDALKEDIFKTFVEHINGLSNTSHKDILRALWDTNQNIPLLRYSVYVK